MRIRIIGIGRPDAGDDGFGWAVLDELATRSLPAGVELCRCTGEATELLDLWQDCAASIVVDAVLGEQAVGSRLVCDLGAEALPAAGNRSSTHGFGLQEAVELARTLERLPSRCYVYGVYGEVSMGASGLGPAVRAQVAGTAAAIRERCAVWAAGREAKHA